MTTFHRFQFGALALILTSSFSAFAQTTVNSEVPASKEAASEWKAITELKDESSALSQSFLKRFGHREDIQSRVNKAVSKLIKTDKDGKSGLISELHKQKICIPLTVGANLDNLIHIPFSVKVGGERCVEPTNVSGQQLLSDSYEGEFRTLGLFKGDVMVRITFQKVFIGSDSQKDALSSPIPYWADVPTNPAEVMEKLAVGQTIRIEFKGDVGLEHFLNEPLGHVKKTAGIEGGKIGIFMVDMYRQSQADVIARFTGVVNRGHYSGNIGLGWRALSGILGRVLHGGVVGEALSADIGGSGEASKLDTMMAVYRFNMKTQDAVDALDEIFTNMKNLAFIRIFNPNTTEENLAQELLKQASQAERFAGDDQDLPHDRQRVEHKFRGRLITNLKKVKPIDGHASLALGGNMGFNLSTTTVRKYNKNNQLDYYVVENRHGFGAIKAANGKWSYSNVEDIDLLAKADGAGNPGQFLDLVKRNEYKEGEFDRGDLKSYTGKIRADIPMALASNEMIDAVLPKNPQNSGTLVIESHIGSKGLNALQGRASNYFALAFQRFMEAKGYEMPPMQEGKLGEYLDQKGSDLAKLFDTSDQVDAKSKAAFDTFGRLKNDDQFRDIIVNQFLPTLLPQDGLEDMMSVNVQFTSNETQASSQSFGQAKVSDIFQAVRFMRRILEEEGDDLNLRLDEVSANNSVK